MRAPSTGCAESSDPPVALPSRRTRLRASSWSSRRNDQELAVARAHGFASPAAEHRVDGEAGRGQRSSQFALRSEAQRRLARELGAVAEPIPDGVTHELAVDTRDLDRLRDGPAARQRN